MIMTIWWPRSGVWIYQIVTGVTSVVGVPSTHLVIKDHITLLALCDGIPLVDFPKKGSAVQKAFSFYDILSGLSLVIINCSCLEQFQQKLLWFLFCFIISWHWSNANSWNYLMWKGILCLSWIPGVLYLYTIQLYNVYHKISNIRCTKSQHLNYSLHVLQLPLPNALRPGCKVENEARC